jgi:hypothetical protein
LFLGLIALERGKEMEKKVCELGKKWRRMRVTKLLLINKEQRKILDFIILQLQILVDGIICMMDE